MKQIFLAIELAQKLFNNPSKFHILKHSKIFLLSNVLQVDGNSKMKFKPEFFNSEFSQTFKQIFDFKFVKADKSFSCSNDKEFWSKISKKLNGNKTLSKEFQSFDSDESFVEEKLKRFMRKLLIATNLEIFKIENALKFKILCQINDINDLKDTYLNFREIFNAWLLRNENKSESTSITKLRIEQIFQPNWIQSQLRQEILQFSISHSENLSKFLLSESDLFEDQILILEVS